MIRVSEPAMTGREREYVLDCLDSNELSSVGKYVTRFEEAFAEFCGVKHAVSCSNGTAALHLALLARGVGPGDHVIVPALTYVATANAVRYCGATPVFCDVDPYTWCIDSEKAEVLCQAFPTIVGIIPVHLYGVPCDMFSLRDLANRHGLWLIEDAAQAHGAVYAEKRVGAFGDLAIFSFYGNKILTCGEGGMVVTNDDEVAERLRLFRGQGVDPQKRYFHTVVGYNYRLTNIQAAIGLAQLETYEQKACALARVFERYRKALDGEFRVQRVTPSGVSANWMFTALLDFGVDRDLVMVVMRSEGVETRPVFPPIQLLPPYQNVYGRVSQQAVHISRRGINLPTYAGLTDADLDKVVDVFQRTARAVS